MNTDTGHLVSAAALQEQLKAARAKSAALEDEIRRMYRPVPDDLAPEAARLLAEGNEVTVPRNSESPLAAWAANRRSAKRAATRAMQKASRKRNR